MAEQEGGRWDVGVKDNAVFVVRISDSDERLFEDQLAPEEARKLAELLRKYAGKVDESAEDDEDDEEDKGKKDKGKKADDDEDDEDEKDEDDDSDDE